MRSLILTAILLQISPSWAISECSPAELQKQCHSAICTTESFIPESIEGIQDELKKFPLPDSLEDELKKYKTSLAEVIERIKKLDDEKAFKEDQLLNEGHHEAIQNLIGGQVKMINGKFIINELSDDPLFPMEAAKEYLSKYHEISTPLHKVMMSYENNDSGIKYEEIKPILEKVVSNEQIAANFSSLKKIIESGKKLSHSDFKKHHVGPIIGFYLESELKSQTSNIESIFRWNLQKLKSINWDKHYSELRDSCLMQNYLMAKIKTYNGKKKGVEHRDKVLTAFNQKFLPLLSESTAAELRKRVKPEIFNFSHNLIDPEIIIRTNSTSENLIGVLGDINKTSTSFCHAEIVTDHFSKDDSNIYISQYSQILGQGETVVAHELGHLVSATLRKKSSKHSKMKFDQLTNCINGFHPNDVDDRDTKGFKYRTEEDFADWMAATIGLGRSDLYCDLANLNNFNVSMKKDSYQSIKEDVHSNNLFRALHIRMVGGEAVPQSCKDFMDLQQERPMKCEL